MGVGGHMCNWVRRNYSNVLLALTEVVVFWRRLYWVRLWESVDPPVLNWFLHEDYTSEVLLLLTRLPSSSEYALVFHSGESATDMLIVLVVAVKGVPHCSSPWSRSGRFSTVPFINVVPNSTLIARITWLHSVSHSVLRGLI